MLSASSDHSPEEKTSTSERLAAPSPNGDGTYENGHTPYPSENDARASLALFEGEPADEEAASRNGEPAKNGSLDLADDASIREFYSQLVSLLTQENAAPAKEPTSRGSLKYALKRRALPAIVVAGIALVGLFWVLKPHTVTYTAATDLLLPPHATTAVADPLDTPEVSYDTDAQVAIMGSDAITTDAMSHVPADLRMKGWGTKEIFAGPVEVTLGSTDPNSSLVTISTASADAEASYALISQMVASYQRYTRQRSTESRDENLKRTQARVATTGAQLNQARQAVANLKIQSGVSDAGVAQNNAAAHIQELESALGAARRAQVSATATDATLAQLQQQLQVAQTAYTNVTRDFFPDSDKAKAAQADVNRAQAAINARRSELEGQSSAQISQLEQELAQARAAAAALPGVEQQQSRLNDRVAILETAYRTATERLNQLTLQRATVAPVATQPRSPIVGSDKTMKTARAIFAALIGALGVGLLAALLLDRADRSVRATSDPEALWNAPVLGALPATNEANAFFRATPSNQKGNSRAKTQNIEACYTTQSNILALAQNSGVRSIIFSSSLKSEDKSTSAANIAVAMAYGGRETLLIDADFWNPTQHKNFGVPISPGYAHVLRDQMPLSEAIRPTMVNNLYVLTPGQDASEGMGALMNRLQGAEHTKNLNLLKKYFDFIVIDGPPATSLADAQLIAHLADAVVLVSAEETPRAEVQRARSMLRLAGAFLLGVVLSHVRPGEVSEWNTLYASENSK